MIWTLGIDNGLHGAVVTINSKFELISYWDTPLIYLKKGNKKAEFAVVEMKKIVEGVYQRAKKDKITLMAWLEYAQAMPKQGLSSTFKTGRGFGLWEGICLGLGLKYDIVHPNTWTKKILFDVAKGEPKSRSMTKCQRIFPELPLTKPNGRVLSLDGRSDAALIAYFGMLQITGKSLIQKSNKIKKKPPRIKLKNGH